MRVGRGCVAAVIVGTALLAGCSTEADRPPPPLALATDGPNQVVIFVPAMVCETCPGKVTEGLATLPWVDAASINADRKVRQVRFTLKDRASFDIERVKEVVAAKGFKGVRLLAGPTES